MTGANHAVFGLIFSIGVGIVLGFPFLIIMDTNSVELWSFLAGVVLGAALPDIDHPGSSIGRRFWPISWIIGKIFGHRGITHSLLGASLILWGLYAWQGGYTIFWVGTALGYVSHLIGDMCTVAGCPMFWPIRVPIRFPFRIRTGTIGEYVVILVAGILLVAVWHIKSQGYF